MSDAVRNGAGAAPALQPSGPAALHAADPTAARSDLGEILLLPPELWQSIDAATEEAVHHDDSVDARAAFGTAFARALHARGLILVARGRSDTREVVTADTYSLALAGKHHAERELHCLRQLILGWEAEHCRLPLLAQLSQGLLALVGRAPPQDRSLVTQAFLRLRGAAAIARHAGDIGEIPPLPEELAELLGASAEPTFQPGAGEIR